MTPRGTPEAKNMVKNVLLDFMITNSPWPMQPLSTTQVWFLKPPPMLYSPSLRNHAKFFQSLGRIGASSCPATIGHSCPCVDCEPLTPGGEQIDHQKGKCADSPGPTPRAANEHAGDHSLQYREQGGLGCGSSDRHRQTGDQHPAGCNFCGVGQPGFRIRCANAGARFDCGVLHHSGRPV